MVTIDRGAGPVVLTDGPDDAYIVEHRPVAGHQVGRVPAGFTPEPEGPDGEIEEGVGIGGDETLG